MLYTKAPETDYMDAALITVMQIHLSEPPGGETPRETPRPSRCGMWGVGEASGNLLGRPSGPGTPEGIAIA